MARSQSLQPSINETPVTAASLASYAILSTAESKATEVKNIKEQLTTYLDSVKQIAVKMDITDKVNEAITVLNKIETKKNDLELFLRLIENIYLIAFDIENISHDKSYALLGYQYCKTLSHLVIEHSAIQAWKFIILSVCGISRCHFELKNPVPVISHTIFEQDCIKNNKSLAELFLKEIKTLAVFFVSNKLFSTGSRLLKLILRFIHESNMPFLKEEYQLLCQTLYLYSQAQLGKEEKSSMLIETDLTKTDLEEEITAFEKRRQTYLAKMSSYSK